MEECHKKVPRISTKHRVTTASFEQFTFSLPPRWEADCKHFRVRSRLFLWHLEHNVSILRKLLRHFPPIRMLKYNFYEKENSKALYLAFLFDNSPERNFRKTDLRRRRGIVKFTNDMLWSSKSGQTHFLFSNVSATLCEYKRLTFNGK